MNKYRLRIDYNHYKNFKKGLVLFLADPYYRSKCEKSLLHKDCVCNSPAIFEEIKPLFYTEDFIDGSFPEKDCYNCKYKITNEKCTDCSDLLSHWEGELLGTPVYEGDKVWFASELLLRVETVQKGDTPADGRYFVNERNADDYYESLQKEESCKTCEFENKSTEMILCSRCIHRHHKLEVIDNNWKEKESTFKVDECVKTPKKWDIGTYIVYLKSTNKNNKGDIDKIINDSPKGKIFTENDSSYFLNYSNFAFHDIKWFATKEEAGEFAKTLKPKLMLGKEEVTFTKLHETDKFSTVQTAEGSVSIAQWLEWFKFINTAMNITKPNILNDDSILYCNLHYYATEIALDREYTQNIIGCIKNISWKQIEAVTKAIYKL